MRESHLFKKQLDEAIAKHSMLSHPFYQLWNEGKLELETLREYAKQYYAHVKAFPTYVSAVHSRCDDMKVRQLLLENLIEEERGEDNHPELWLRFAESLGVVRDDVRNAELLPSTVRSVQQIKSLTSSADYTQGVAALYAYESQIPEVARTKRQGLKEFYGIDDARSVAFFTVHESVDQVHRQSEMKVLNDICDTDTGRSAAVAAASGAAQSLWNFLSGIQAAYVTN